MATRERPRDRALAASDRLRASVGLEIRLARRGAGLSIRAAAVSVGMHPSTLGRLERNDLRTASVEQLAIACAAVGLELVIRAYPRGDPVRDAAHLRLLSRFRSRLPSTLPWRTEVPLPIPGDLRALDGQLWIDGEMLAVEAETRLQDLQALERRVLLKKRDSRAKRLVLLVAETPHNRAILVAHRDAMRGSFPLDTREVLGSLARGQMPPEDGIVVI